MARDREEHEEYGESVRTNVRSDPDDGLNAYYTRKQRTKANRFGCDYPADYAERDRDADQETNFKEPNASFLNYKKWDKYGRT